MKQNNVLLKFARTSYSIHKFKNSAKLKNKRIY